ncbi:MAG: hypothetical protein JWN52_2056 [Actinomycetia bacterium]|nr:hypothetical protein [Actinomycetes bacterium]
MSLPSGPRRGAFGPPCIAILRETITPPVGGLTFETYQVIAHVQRGDTVERSTVSIAPNGSLVEQCRILATGLPIPYLV